MLLAVRRQRRRKRQSKRAHSRLPYSKHEALPLSMRWTAADLALAAPGPEWRLSLVNVAANYQCTTSWCKDKHSERNMPKQTRCASANANRTLLSRPKTKGLDF